VKQGDIYSPLALAETTRSLYELGRFSQVKIVVDTKDFGPVVPIQINVTRASNTELQLGGGAGYDPLSIEARTRGRFTFVPDEHPLQTWSVDGRFAVTRQTATGAIEPKVRVLFGFQRVEFLRPKLVLDLSAGFDFFTVEAYTATGVLPRASLSYPLVGRGLTVQVGWALSYLQFSALNPVLTQNDADADGVIDPACPECDRDRRELGLNEPELNGRFEQAIVADLRDSQLEPRKGGYLSLRITEGTIAAGGTLDYIMLQPDLRAYYPVWRFVLAARLRGGTILGDVPVTQRFFSGGAQNHRGFSARRLAPLVQRFNNFGQLVGEVPIGGQTFIEAGIEARTVLGELKGLPIGLTLFLDLGDVVFENQQLAIDWTRPDLGLHAAAGAGLFVKLGGFKIRVDVGKRLNRLPVGIGGAVNDGLFENIEFFLAVGETF
jgi:outer membrane protein assembly factor BamA